MKILLINDNGVEIGGVETYLKNLKNELIKQGHDVKIFTQKPSKDDESFSDYSFKGINKKSRFRLIPYMFNISSLISLKKAIKDFQPDIIHLHFIFYHTSPSILLGLRNIPTIMTIHAHELIAPVGVNYSVNCKHPFIGYCIKCTGFMKYYPEKIKRFYFRKLSGKIRQYITPSKYYEYLYRNAGFSPVQYLHNGISISQAYEHVDSSKQNILFVGRLAPEKGAESIVRAMPVILKSFPNTILTIVGDGSDKQRLEKLIEELDIKRQIILIGKLENKDVEKYFRNTTIVVVPSTYPDNLPTVCIEAMNYGRAIVAANIGGIPELVDNGVSGLLFNPGDYDDLADKIKILFSNKELLTRFSYNARKKMEQFDIKDHANKLLKLYRKSIS